MSRDLRNARWFGGFVAVVIGVCAGGARAASRDDFVTPHRFQLRFGAAFGYVAMSRLHEGVADLRGNIERSSGTRLESDPKSNFVLGAEMQFRYYFPLHIFAQVGVGALYNNGAANIGTGVARASVTNYNLAMEIPVLVGGYWGLAKRFYVWAGVGPTFFFYTRSWWDSTVGALPDFGGGGGVGFLGAAGTDFMLSRHFGLGLELSGRYLQSGDLSDLKTGAVLTSGSLRGDASNGRYQMDLSGVTFGVKMLFVL